jgi:hypothetical protein
MTYYNKFKCNKNPCGISTNDVVLGPSDKGWVLQTSNIGLSDLLHFIDIGCSDVDLGPNDKGWMTHC